MTRENNLQTGQINPISLKKRILWGAGIGLVLISLFLFGVEGAPEWGPYWKVRPLIVVPIAGAMGAGWYYFMERLGSEGGWKKIFCTLLGLFGYVVAIWLGSVFGLDGTLWN